MNIPIDTSAMQDRGVIPQMSHVAPPEGWQMGEELQISTTSLPSVIESFENTVNRTLPYAAERTESLINTLYDRFGISVSTAYLNVDTEATYHALLLVTQKEFHSPYMQAAHILVKMYTSNSSALPIRFSFGVGREHITSNFSGNQYKFKYVHSIEAPTPMISSVRKEMVA